MRTRDDLRRLQALPLEIKIKMTQRRIRDWVKKYGEDGVYVSFSGGKDSTVLLHIVREMYPDIEAVFVNTGLEYPEIQKFVKTFANVTILRPKMRFDEVNVDPDVIADFTAIPFESNTFYLVVFDPPHLLRAGETAWLVKKYGKLEDNWPQMLKDGFAECMRVLRPNGVLIFKWSEAQIPAARVWKAIGCKPLFGHHSGKQSKTFWGCFMKGEL